MTEQDKIRRLKPFDEGKYENVDLDHLVMYVMSQLDRIGVDLSFENAVVAAFKIFPKKFSLLGFPWYPDAKRVHDCLFRCTFRTKQWLGGKTSQGFTITDRSKIFIQEAESLLAGVMPQKKKATSQTRRKEKLVAEVVSSAGYGKYTAGKKDSITEADVCFLLQATLDSSRETLRRNLGSLRTFAKELRRHDIVRFLDWLEERFKNLLRINQRQEVSHGTRSH